MIAKSLACLIILAIAVGPAAPDEPAKNSVNTIGMKLVTIPAGKFQMGSPTHEEDDERLHEVTITRPFLMGKHEVTVGQFRAFVKDTGYRTAAEKDSKGGRAFDGKEFIWKPEFTWKSLYIAQTDDEPVVVIAWDDAVAFCAWLSKKEGKTYRLPTEAEWEYACRAGTKTRYQHGDEVEGLRHVGNIADAALKRKWTDVTWSMGWDDGYSYTSPVGKFAPNDFGLHDMVGNAWEWCADWYGGDYPKGPAEDPQGPATGKLRVTRGGAWSTQPKFCRSAFRDWHEPGYRSDCVGFRVVQELAAERAPHPGDNSPDEPVAKKWSLAKSAAFLDASSDYWLEKHECAACHTHYPYVMALASFGQPSPGGQRVRAFLEKRVAGWDKGRPPDPGAEGITEVVATAASLAFHDAASTGKLHPLSRQALERMWTVQQENGAWDWNKHGLPPVEHDDYFGAVFAAVGVAAAPEGYAQSDAARAGLAKLRRFFKNHPAPDLHHQTWLLWASARLDRLLSAEQQTATRKKLLSLQRADGGWSLPALGSWKRHDGSDNEAVASDGYATGLVVYVLLQSGSTPKDEAIIRGVRWLETNQRESGRWFTRSLNSERRHYMTQAGAAFAVMALRAAGRIE